MKPIIFILLIFVGCMIIGGCKKPSNTITGGGKGGTCVIRAIGEAHGFFIDTCIVYIKYNTLDEPANGIYDDSLVCTVVNDTPSAVFDSLTVGNYYLYAVGYHGAYSPPNVEGGKTVTISQNGTVTVYIPAYAYIL